MRPVVPRLPLRPTLLALSIALQAPLPGLAAEAQPAPTLRDYALPAGPLAERLNQIASEAGLILVLDPALTAQRRASPVQGRLDGQAALQMALRDSGLALERTQLGTFQLKDPSRKPPKAARNEVLLPSITVVGDRLSSDTVGRSYLSREDVASQQASNVAALLDTLPGVDLSGSARPGGQSLNIWGFNKVQDVKVIVDGAPKGFEKYRQGSVFIEPELIKSLEVNKGPHTALYGNGGFGGVVSIETKDAKDLLRAGEQIGGLIKYSHHTNNREHDGTLALYAASEDGRFDGLAYYTQRHADDLKKPDGTPFRFSAMDTPSALAKLNFRPTDGQVITVSAMQSKSTGWVPFAAMGEDVATPTEAEIKKYGWEGAWQRKVLYRDQQDDTASIKWRYQPSGNPLLNLTASYAHSKTRQHDRRPDTAAQGSFLGSLGNESWASYRDELAELRNESAFSTGALVHVLTVGGQLHQNRRETLMYYPSSTALKDPSYNYGYFQPYYMPGGRQDTRAAFVQDAVSYDSLTVTAALRYDEVESEGTPNLATRYNSPNPLAGHDYRTVIYRGLSPRLGLFWKTSEGSALFADLSRTWRAPTIDELYTTQYYVSASNSSNVPGTSRQLERERILASRLGAMFSGRNLLSAGDDGLLRITLFHNRVRQAINLQRGTYYFGYQSGMPVPAALPNYRNLPGYHSEGLELEGFYNTPRLFASLSLAVQHGKRDGSQNNPWAEDEPISAIAPAKLISQLGLKFPAWGAAIGWQGRFVAAQHKVLPLGNVYRLPPSAGYGLHGLFASWQGREGALQGLEARLTVDNLFDKTYQPYLSEAVTGVGRNVKLSLAKFF